MNLHRNLCSCEVMHSSNICHWLEFVHLNRTEPDNNVAIALGSTVQSSLFNTVSTSQILLTVQIIVFVVFFFVFFGWWNTQTLKCNSRVALKVAVTHRRVFFSGQIWHFLLFRVDSVLVNSNTHGQSVNLTPTNTILRLRKKNAD